MIRNKQNNRTKIAHGETNKQTNKQTVKDISK